MNRPAPRQGLYEDAYWQHAAAEELRLQRCVRCGRFRYPPGPICPDCLGEGYDWEPLSGAGELLAWTTFHRQYFPELPPPYVVAAVLTAEGPVLVGNLVDIADGTELTHGMPLVAVPEPVQPTGRIWQWTPDQHDKRDKHDNSKENR